MVFECIYIMLLMLLWKALACIEKTLSKNLWVKGRRKQMENKKDLNKNNKTSESKFERNLKEILQESF